MKLSVAMITMNEEKAIAKVVADIRRAIEGIESEIVIVDSSKDTTPEIAESLGVRVIRQFPPQGYGRAMGRVLSESRGDVVITLDCDDTYPAEDIPKLFEMVRLNECDLVNASRLQRKPKAMPWANYMANWLFARAARLLLGVKSTDLHSGMRAYRRSIIEKVEFDPNGPALPVELLLKPALLGFRVKEVFIPYRDRIGTTTLGRWESTVWTFKRITRLFPLIFAKKVAEPVTVK